DAPVLVIALGLSGAVAPLTTAVLSSVDARHTASASGFNSAVARTGGLVATALLGTVLAAHGPALLASFHAAMIAGAAACAAAAFSALSLLAVIKHQPNARPWRGLPRPLWGGRLAGWANVRLPIPMAAFRAQGRLGQLSSINGLCLALESEGWSGPVPGHVCRRPAAGWGH